MNQILISHWWLSSHFQLHPYWTSSLSPHKFYKFFLLTSILPLRKARKQHSLTGSTWNKFCVFHPRFLGPYSWKKNKNTVLIYSQNHLRQAYKRQSIYRPPLSVPHWISDRAPKHKSPLPWQKSPPKPTQHKCSWCEHFLIGFSYKWVRWSCRWLNLSWGHSREKKTAVGEKIVLLPVWVLMYTQILIWVKYKSRSTTRKTK